MSYTDFTGQVKPTNDLDGNAAVEAVSGIDLINHNGQVAFAEGGNILERNSRVYGVLLEAKIASAAPDSPLRGLSPYGTVRSIGQVPPYNITVRWSDNAMINIAAKDFFWDYERNVWRVD